MKVRMLTSVSSASGSYSANAVCEVPDAVGKSWVKGGWAELVKVPKKKAAPKKII
jgi:hypothetical protein